MAFLWQPAISNVNVRDIVHNFCYRNLDQPTLAMTTSTNTPTDNPEVPDAQTITASQMPITVRDGEPDNEETVSSMSPSNRDATTANEEPTASGERDRSKRHDADTGVTDIPHPDEMTTQAQHLIFQTIEGIGGGDEASGGEPTDPPVTTKEEISFNTRDNARPDGPGGPFGWTCTALLTRPVLTINGVDHTFDALLTNLPVSTRYAIVVQVATTDGIHNGEFTNESIFRTPDGGKLLLPVLLHRLRCGAWLQLLSCLVTTRIRIDRFRTGGGLPPVMFHAHEIFYNSFTAFPTNRRPQECNME